MPGSIQVSVLEFKSSSSSPTSLKVSMGRRAYETWDNGEFSFPVTTLRDNLIVALLDADGNEVARTGVGIMLIVENGSWDDYFPLDGGGEVHMKLEFVLSEEDRDRVRLLRESALRKKQQKDSTEVVDSSSVDYEQKITDIMKPVPSQDTEMSVRRKVVSAEDEAVDTSSLLLHRMEDPRVTEVQRESVEVHETIQQRGKDDLRPSSDQEASSTSGSLGSEIQFEKRPISQKPNDGPLQRSEAQKPMKRTPSAIWKVISAFETNLSQDPRTSVKSPNPKSQSNQVGKRDYLRDTDSKGVTTPAESNSEGVTTPAESNSDFLPNLFLDGKETSSLDSGMAENIYSDSQAGEMLIAQNDKYKDQQKEDVGSTRIPNEPQEEDIDIKRVVGETDEVSILKEIVKLPPDLARYSERTFSGRINEENNSFESSVMETFPNNTRRLCITTAGKEVMSLFEKHEPEESKAPDSENPGLVSNIEGVMSQGDQPKKKDYRGFGVQRNTRPDGTPDALGGLVGQAIKLAIMVGFGALVLLTRQREPRKGKTKAKNLSDDQSGFVDGPYIVGPMD